MPKETRGTIRPTVVSPPARKKGPPAASAAAAPEESKRARPVTLSAPTAIPGVARRRIPVEASDLRKLSPGVAAGVLDRALALIAGFVLEKATERKAVLWGHELQKSYGDAIAGALALSQAPVLRKIEGYIARMMEILQAVDLLAAVGHAGGGFGQYLKGINKKIDTPDELAAARNELGQLVHHMGGALDELLDLKAKLERNAAELNRVAAEAEASALAALFLSQYLGKEQPQLAERFVERSMSLTQTLAQIRENGAIREIQIEHPIRMVGAIQNVALVSMPDFLASIAAINSIAARNRAMSPTEAGELNYKLRDIIEQLKT